MVVGRLAHAARSTVSRLALPELGGRCARARRWSSWQAEGELNPETVSYLVDRSSAREVYLVGTAHVSAASSDDVRHTIAVARPHHIMVELCADRARRLRDGKQPKTVEEIARDFLQQLMQQRTPNQVPGFGVELVLKAGLSAFYAFLRQLGLDSGQEFKAALEEAARLQLKVCLGDRDVNETMQRLRQALSKTPFHEVMHAPPPPAGLFADRRINYHDLSSLAASVEELKNRRQIRILREYMTGVVPHIMEAMVKERDVIMTEKILNECGIGRTVAVVGMAHMDGIEEEWRQRGGEVFLHADNSLRSP